MSEWVCFQEGMPATFATDLEINYCTQELFAGTFGRGIWKTPINLPDSEPVVITDDLTWGGTQTFDHDIIIESGNTLTLTGTLKMAGSKHIIVEQGAELKINGGTLTSACDAFWGGVIVQGDFSLEQTSTNQGVVTLLNDALIENATVGVALWQHGDWTSTGGIIYSSNATFKNNKKDVEFIQYTNHNGYGVLPNVSRFTNTTFTWTDDFMADNPLGHVTMYWVDGIRFNACDFIDERTSPASRYQTDYGRNNSGIYSLDAHYYVLAGCEDISGCTGPLDTDGDEIDEDDWKPCTFTNLDFGIYAANNVTEHAITVDRAVFTNNLYGVQIVNVNGPAINRNLFQYTNDENNFEDYTSYGIHLLKSGGIKVEENVLINSTSSSLVDGIIAANLGETEELLYKNEFTNLEYAIAAVGKNRSYDPSGTETPKGLQFQCNTNVDNIYDHFVIGSFAPGAETPYYGVKALNGSASNPSGNTFSALSEAIDGEHYYNTSNSISYFYYNGEDNEEPLDYLGDFIPSGIDVVNNCATQLTEFPYISYSGSGIAPYKTDFNTASSAIATKKAAYSSLLNGGNTSALLAAIASMTTSNASSIRTNLLNTSPYLTDTVIRAALDKSNAIFPNSWGYELVMENIEVAYNSDFIDFLSTKTNPMPSWMIEDIEDAVAAGTSTDMLMKQSELAELEKVKSYAANQILHAFKNDTTGIEIDSLRYWVNQKNDLLVQTRIIDTYLNEGDYSTATTKLNALESAISSYPMHVQTELTDYVSYKEKMVALLSSGSPLDSLSETDYTFVEAHANESEGIARYQAQELLCFFYGNCADYAVVFPQTTQSMAQVIPSEKTDIKRAFEVYPNPAKDWVTIVTPEVEGQAQLTITDLTGRVILVETISKNLFNWDTKTMSDGTYLITLINLTTGERIGAEKVVLQH
ncbi:MAG: T9SS type A sorting domain-containing protein [Crocinitomix sp.]|nr:T9SS type A sorting domain-containing protein [Crocinitomix sp.]